MEMIVFLIAGAFAIIGALGLVLSSNPVHSALMLVMALFAIAVLFLNQDAQFLAAVQVIVYTGAIVVLFLFVIMLLGVDEAEDLDVEPIAGQRSLAAVIGVATFGLGIAVLVAATDGATGVATNAIDDSATNVSDLARLLFVDYIYAFELTAALLTIAVVGAVLLARKPRGEYQPAPEVEELVDPEPLFQFPWNRDGAVGETNGDSGASDADEPDDVDAEIEESSP